MPPKFRRNASIEVYGRIYISVSLPESGFNSNMIVLEAFLPKYTITLTLGPIIINCWSITTY